MKNKAISIITIKFLNDLNDMIRSLKNKKIKFLYNSKNLSMKRRRMVVVRNIYEKTPCF